MVPELVRMGADGGRAVLPRAVRRHPEDGIARNRTPAVVL
jgi:hypothetical protein